MMGDSRLPLADPFKDRCLSLFDLQEHGLGVGRHEEANGAECPDTADADDLEGEIRGACSGREEHAGQEAVFRDRPKMPSAL